MKAVFEMSSKTVITVLGSPQEVQRRWNEGGYRPDYIESSDAAVQFKPAPGDRGTEIHVDLGGSASSGGTLGDLVRKVTGNSRWPRSKTTCGASRRWPRPVSSPAPTEPPRESGQSAS
jgi:hypothetical protein